MNAVTPRIHHRLSATPETVVWGFLGPATPVLHIRSGDVVQIDTVNPIGVPPDGAPAFYENHRIETVGAIADTVAIMRSVAKDVGPHILTGPIHIAEAEPGDALAVEVLAVEPRPPYFGVNFTRPDAGSIPGTVQENWLKIIRCDIERQVAIFDERIEIPLDPFMGTMGVAPREKVSSIPPGSFGGNLDLKDLRPGATLYLPVQVPGALFFTGDGHAMQGNGEVNLTALETAMTATMRFVLHKRSALRAPIAETAQHYIVLGLHEDLDVAARSAVDAAVDALVLFAGLDRVEAYSLASLAVDFELTQIVDGVKGVHGRIPKQIVAPGRASPWGPPLPASESRIGHSGRSSP